MSVRLAACCAVAALMIPASGSAQADTGDAVRNWAAISECGAISDAGRRLACMDDVLRRAGIGSGAVAAQLPAPRGAEQASADQPGTTPARTPQRNAPAQPQPSPVSREAAPLATTITSVQTVGYRKVLVTTADGSAWEQTEAEEFLTAPKAGDAFSVEPAAMNSFRCRFNQSSRYRCRQVN